MGHIEIIHLRRSLISFVKGRQQCALSSCEYTVLASAVAAVTFGTTVWPGAKSAILLVF